jgi:hypothetical protein
MKTRASGRVRREGMLVVDWDVTAAVFFIFYFSLRFHRYDYDIFQWLFVSFTGQ